MRSYLVIITATLVFSSCGREAHVEPLADIPVRTSTLPVKGASGEAIRFLEDRVKNDPEDFVALNKLSSSYLQQVRETGDITYLELASRAAKNSLAVLPAEHNKGGLAALVQVEFSSHDFASAKRDALRLVELEPEKAYPYQSLGDCNVELGEYAEAEAAYKKMRELGGVQPLTRAATEERLARLALLKGQDQEAKQRFESARKELTSIPEPPPEALAWCHLQIGDLAFAHGDHTNAEKSYREALNTFPNFYKALGSLARVRAAQGDAAAAIGLYEQTVNIVPDPIFIAALGDLYKLAGRETDAERQYLLVEKMGHLSELSGTLYNRQLAWFYADHDRRLDDAYTNASKEYEVRRDIYGADALAWAALKSGRLDEAATAVKEALKLGTNDARLFYHAGMIAKASGDNGEAIKFLNKALTLNPSFDPLQALEARKALADLTGK